ncbi:hypothetical protein [Caldalkalibacillus salinus]|uniref:hypothetical protein n=1 Tax=Caldalkalibacillus salinus TaxID=2803787 RepID=UPI001922FC0F|nr:hypothetical protein [Caldalkalibacillus salinus]
MGKQALQVTFCKSVGDRGFDLKRFEVGSDNGFQKSFRSKKFEKFLENAEVAIDVRIASPSCSISGMILWVRS